MDVNPKSNPNCSMLHSSMGVGDMMSCAPQMNPNSGTGTVWSTHVHLVRIHWCLHYSVRGQATGSVRNISQQFLDLIFRISFV